MKNIIWDFDGTLFDTYKVMVAAVVNALMDLGIDEIEIDEYEIYATMRQHTKQTAIKKLASFYGLNEEGLSTLSNRYEDDSLITSEPIKGAVTVLAEFANRGYQQFVVTHRDQATLMLLDKYKLRSLFTEIITKEAGFKRKPAPDALNMLITKYQLAREQTVMIGDRSLDVVAGNNANIKTVLFDKDALILNGGNYDFKVSRLADLLDQFN